MRTRKWACLLLSLILLIAFLPATVLAAAGVDGSKTAAPTELYPDQRETEVTLKLPSEEGKHEYDIVFVMDASTSTVNSNIDFANNVNVMLQELAEKNALVKIAVIKFRGKAFDMINIVSGETLSGFVEYSEDTAGYIAEAINYPETLLKEISSGSGLHVGLDKADELLSDDVSVPDENKFVIALTDGKSYIWNNAANEPTTYYTQWYKHYAIQNSGKAVLSQSAGASDKEAYPVTVLDQPVFWFTNYADLYASTDEEIAATDTVFDQYCKYAKKQGTPAGSVNTYTASNGAALFPSRQSYQKYYEFVPSEDWAGMTWLEANPYKIIKTSDGYMFDPENYNPNYYMFHPDCLQKGLYQAGHLWTAMDQKYNTAAVTFDGWDPGSGLSIAKSFCPWFIEHSDYGADIANTEAVLAMFDSIKEEIIYMVDSGTVTDVIPDEFTLVEDGTDTFKMTRGGEALEVSADGDAAWNYGEADGGGSYPYRVEYDAETKTISWIINVPVENAFPITLSYKLLIDEDAEMGEHDTNVSAVLDYTPTGGVPLQYTFSVPAVTYTYYYKVTYKDGVEGTVFADQVTEKIPAGHDTPGFEGSTERPGYVFAGWDPEVADTVTEDAEYTAQWTPADDTAYKVEHWLETAGSDADLNSLAADFELAETEELTGTTGETVTAVPKTYEGFEFDETVAGTIKEGVVAADGSLVLRLYYVRKAYTVTYEYTGTVPENASALPETKTYRFGETVQVADDAAAEGYEFSGWDREGSFTMPAEDVTITGSFEKKEPTPTPTEEPTPTPTEEPTPTPTEEPTPTPTEEPTPTPTEEPTQAPTDVPTVTPTANPTHITTPQPVPPTPTSVPPTAPPTRPSGQQPQGPGVPKTGDTQNLPFWGVFFILSAAAAGTAAVLYAKKRRKA